jgi:hypothetical protein
MDGADDGVEVQRDLVGDGEDGCDEVIELVEGEGVGVLTGAQGVEVAGWGAGAARAQLVVAVGAAEGARPHGPIAATGYLTGALGGVSGHGYGSLGEIIAHMF